MVSSVPGACLTIMAVSQAAVNIRKIFCPSCGQKISIDARDLRKRVACPRCAVTHHLGELIPRAVTLDAVPVPENDSPPTIPVAIVTGSSYGEDVDLGQQSRVVPVYAPVVRPPALLPPLPLRTPVPGTPPPPTGSAVSPGVAVDQGHSNEPVRAAATNIWAEPPIEQALVTIRPESFAALRKAAGWLNNRVQDRRASVLGFLVVLSASGRVFESSKLELLSMGAFYALAMAFAVARFAAGPEDGRWSASEVLEETPTSSPTGWQQLRHA